MKRLLVIDYLKSSVGQARYWAEVCLDPEDDCPAFRSQVRSILSDALTVLRANDLFPDIQATIADVIAASFDETMRPANERLQHLTELLQALEAQISMEVSGNAGEAKAAATTTSQ